MILSNTSCSIPSIIINVEARINELNIVDEICIKYEVLNFPSIVVKSLDSILKRLDILKDRQSSFDEEENTDPKHAAAVKRKKKLIDQAKRDNVGLGWTKGIGDDKKKAHKSKYFLDKKKIYN